MNATSHTKPLFSNSSVYAMTAYFILLFYNAGVALMTYFVGYPAWANVHEHLRAYTDVVISRMTWFSALPAAALPAATLFLWLYRPPTFPRWAASASVVLAAVYSGATLFVVFPLYKEINAAGLIGPARERIFSESMRFQVAPVVLLLFIAVIALNNLLEETRPLPRWIFIFVFSLTFYTLGTNCMEEFVNYPAWLKVGSTDWNGFRHAGTVGAFAGLYLIPSYFPLFLGAWMLWKRPPGVPRSFAAAILLTELWILIVSAVYFVPRLQIALNNKGFSEPLIQELIRNSFLYRQIPALALWGVVGWMFIKICRYQAFLGSMV